MLWSLDAYYDDVKRRGIAPAPHFHNRTTYHQLRLVYERSLAHISPPADVLDWGCGEGHFSTFLVDHGFRTVGFSFVDIPAHLRTAASFKHVRGNQAAPIQLPFPDGNFDAVFSIGVLEHVHETGGDQLASMRELWRILRPGGLFLCFHFPNSGSWIEWLANRTRNSAYKHSRKFTRSDIDHLATDARFSLLETGRYGFFPRNILQRLPRRLTDGARVAAAFDALDDGLAAVFPGLCQSHYFIARKA